MKRFLRYSEDKVRGLLFGTFIGDAIGAIFEGQEPDQIPPLHEELVYGYAPLNYTDDMQMTISVFEEMLENGEIDQQNLRDRFLKRFSPWRRYGGGMLEVIERWRNKESITEAAAKLYGGVGSFGDGAAMRVAPISAFSSLSNPDDLVEQVTRCSVLTHTHSYGISGAILQAYAVLLALNDVPLDQWVRLLFQLNIESAYKIKLEDVVKALEHQISPLEAARLVGNGADALDAVPAAIFSALRNKMVFSDTVLFAVAMGGDTDTIAAMAGSIAGAAHGVNAISKNLMNILENEKEGKTFVDSMVFKAVRSSEKIRRGEDSNLR